MAMVQPAGASGDSSLSGEAEVAVRPKGEFIDVSDALFIVAAISAAFVGGLLIIEWMTRGDRVPVPPGSGREVALGDFRLGLSQLVKPRLVEFEATAIVGGSPAAQNLYEQRLKSHSARISQAVEEAGRATTDAELDDPELSSFRDRIQGKVNTVLGARAVESVLIDEFRAVDQ